MKKISELTSKIIFFVFLIQFINGHLHAQILNSLGSRTVVHSTSTNEEYSGLAYSPIDEVFIMPMDSPSPSGEYHFKGYDPNSNQVYDITFGGALNPDDLEGFTYLEDNFFALIEEKANRVYFYTYDHTNKNLVASGNASTGIPLGSNGDGLEGITYDPHTNRLFFVREHFPIELFSIEVVLPTSTTPGSLTGPLASVQLDPLHFDDPYSNNSDQDASGLHHLGQNYDLACNLGSNLLILSEGNRKILEYKVNVTSQNILSLTLIDEKFITLEPQPEGITLVDNKIYIASERATAGNNASLSFYPFSSVNLNLTYFIEGPFDASSGVLTSGINSRGLLPGQTPINNLVSPTPAGHPYHTLPWEYKGLEGAGFTDADYTTDDVDWVLVSLRTSPSIADTICRAAALLQKNGSIRFMDDFNFYSLDQMSYYIVIEHKSHLPVMSASAVPLVNNELVFDFTTADSYISSSSGQKELLPGVWAAFSGNGHQDDLVIDSDDITGADKALWLSVNGTFDTYHSSDFDLDGDTNGQDKIQWNNNNGIFCAVNSQ